MLGDRTQSWAELYARSSQAAQAMADYNRVHAEQIARLVDTLSAIPDPQGGSLMDHTLIVWGSEMADGWHGYEHYPCATLGGSWAWDIMPEAHFTLNQRQHVMANVGIRFPLTQP